MTLRRPFLMSWRNIDIMLTTPTKRVNRKPCAVVKMPDGEMYPILNLLGKGPSNAKTAKNGDRAHSLYLSILPHKVEGRPDLGNVCPHASDGCISLCINVSGLSAADWAPRDMIMAGRLARRILYFKQRAKFLEMWDYEIRAGVRAAAKVGLPLVVRPNIFSDIDWYRKHPEMFDPFPGIVCHDYTKDIEKFKKFLDGEYPTNYHLTFSRSEDNEEACLELLGRGGNVAVVFQVKYRYDWGHPLPETWKGFKVIDGDKTDLRHLDPRGKPGVVVGLRAKGKARVAGFSGSPFIVAVPA